MIFHSPNYLIILFFDKDTKKALNMKLILIGHLVLLANMLCATANEEYVQLAHIMNQMPINPKIPLNARLSYAKHVYKKIIMEKNQKKQKDMILKKKQEEEKRVTEMFQKYLKEKSKHSSFLRDFNTIRMF